MLLAAPNFSHRFSTRSVVILIFASVSSFLAITDVNYRPRFADLSYMALGGYLAQLLPKERGRNE